MRRKRCTILVGTIPVFVFITGADMLYYSYQLYILQQILRIGHCFAFQVVACKYTCVNVWIVN